MCTATEQADGQCAAEMKVPFCSREHIPYSIFACTATEQPDRHTHTHTHTHTHIPNSLTGSAKQALSRISTQTRTEHAHTHTHTHTHIPNSLTGSAKQAPSATKAPSATASGTGKPDQEDEKLQNCTLTLVPYTQTLYPTLYPNP